MNKLTETAAYHLWLLSIQKGPMQVDTLKIKYKNIRQQTLDALTKNTYPKPLVRIRKGYYGRKDRVEITAAGRAKISTTINNTRKWKRLNSDIFFRKVK